MEFPCEGNTQRGYGIGDKLYRHCSTLEPSVNTNLLPDDKNELDCTVADYGRGADKKVNKCGRLYQFFVPNNRRNDNLYDYCVTWYSQGRK